MELTSENFKRQLTHFFWENGETPDPMAIDTLAYFAELLVQKNEVLNLVSRKDIESVVENHVFISGFISKFIPEKCKNYIDIGTGGGFPGLPIAIMRPEMKGVLVDSIKKKTDAVDEFIHKLMLSNVKVENTRVESEQFIEKYRKSFDVILSRATVPMDLLIRYALPVAKDKAYVVVMKGGDLKEEIDKMMLKYEAFIKKVTIFELHYKPTNIKNIKDKKLVYLEISK